MVVTLFNRNYDGQNEGQSEGQNEGQNIKLDISKRRNKVLELIRENNQITSTMLKDILGVSKATIERDLSKLKKENKIEYIGSSKNGYWKTKE